MRQMIYRARWAFAACACVALAALTACDWKNQLLEPQNPGLIDPSAVNSPAAAAALRVGAIGRLRNLVNCGGGECLWEEAGHLADEYKNADFQPTRQDIDQRTITTNNTILSYSTITQIRGPIRDAIRAMKKYLPDSTSQIGELYVSLAFVELSLAENYCNGIPLGSTENGVVTLGQPLTNQQVLDSASAHLDTALLVTTANDAGSVFIRQTAWVTKARVLVDKGQWQQAAALVTTTNVPSTFQYVWTSSAALNTDDLGIWTLVNSVARVSVADSIDNWNGTQYLIRNAIPFSSANDPRIPVLSGRLTSPKVAPEDGATDMYVQLLWKNRDDPIPMVSGIDARLIEAEAQLKAGNISAMMTILNALRTAPPKIGNFQPAVMATLPDPPDQASAVSLFFREKAFWTFGRGQRLNDLRRMIRQYGRTDDQVFPSGVYPKGGQFGHDVNFPVPDAELVNPNFKGCLDRNA
jgi:hypothetical protein